MLYLKRVFVFRGKATKSGKNFLWIILLCVVSIVVAVPLSHPHLAIADITVTLNRNLILNPSDDFNMDQDHDALIDYLEGYLASFFRPYFKFDYDENARRPEEPVTIFQVHPMDITAGSIKQIIIKWVFLFRDDGGYGPDSGGLCTNDHEGDNDTAYYVLESGDGITWAVVRIGLSFKGLEWPTNVSILDLEPLNPPYNGSYPVVYMSAHKHHEYFHTYYDHEDSLYSDYGCNEDVNGLGDQFIANLESLEAANGYYNNVGESNGAYNLINAPQDNHNSTYFVNDFSPFYPGHSAWGGDLFYSTDAGRTSDKWLDDPTYGIAYVDWENIFGGLPEGSSFVRPFQTIAQSYSHVNFRDGSWINIWSGSYPEILTISKSSILRAIDGPVIIGE